MAGVIVGARLDAHQNPTFFDALLVVLYSFLRDAPTHQCA
jgi:hypothetical protein